MADPIAPDLIATDPRFGPLAEATRRLEGIPLDGLLTYLIDTAPASYLPELARQFHISGLEGWHLATTDEARRALIKRSIAMHRKKGTPWAIHRALTISGIEAVLTEWWQRTPPGQPYTFMVDIAAGQPAARDAAGFEAARRHVDEWKPISRHASYRIAAAARAAAAIAACGIVHMLWQGAGELLAQPALGTSAHASAAAGHGFMLMICGGALQ